MSPTSIASNRLPTLKAAGSAEAIAVEAAVPVAVAEAATTGVAAEDADPAVLVVTAVDKAVAADKR